MQEMITANACRYLIGSGLDIVVELGRGGSIGQGLHFSGNWCRRGIPELVPAVHAKRWLHVPIAGGQRAATAWAGEDHGRQGTFYFLIADAM
jgi:hypothetical protein